MTTGRDQPLGHCDQDGYLDRFYCRFVVSTRALVFLALRRLVGDIRGKYLGWRGSRDRTRRNISRRGLQERRLGRIHQSSHEGAAVHRDVCGSGERVGGGCRNMWRVGLVRVLDISYSHRLEARKSAHSILWKPVKYLELGPTPDVLAQREVAE